MWHSVEIRTDTHEALVACEPLYQRAVQPVLPVATMRLEIRAHGEGYEVYDNGDLLTTCGGADEAGVAVFERVQRRAFELASLRGWLRIHGAVLDVAGRRVAVIGPSGSGKTTLCIAALAAGHRVEADESFLTDGRDVLAVPRRFHCEAGTLDLVPAAQPWVESAPVLSDEPVTWALDPSIAVADWAVRIAPLDAIVLLDGSRPPGLAPVTMPDALPQLLSQTLPTVESRAAVMARLAPLLGQVRVLALGGGHQLTPGERLRLLASLT